LLPRERLRRRAEALIHRFLEEVAERYGPSCVILFGSYARGGFTESSDIDVCVVSPRLPASIHERRTIHHGVPRVRAIGYWPEEFVEEIRRGNPLVLDIVYYGKPLRGLDEFRRYKKELEEAVSRMGLMRGEGGWRRVRRPR